MADIVDKIIGRLAEQLPGESIELLRRVEVQVRAEFGGDSAGYIRKAPALQRAEAIGAQLRGGASLAQAVEAAGISRRHGYRILARPLLKPGR